MRKFGRWVRNSLLGALALGLAALFGRTVRWAVKELFGSAVEEWLAEQLGRLTGIEEAQVLAAGTILAVPALVFLVGIYAAVLVTKHLMKRERLSEGEPLGTGDPGARLAAAARAAKAAPARSTPKLTAAPSPEPDWRKLYEIAADTGAVRLRFLPDTEHQECDALLLAVFGHKALKNEDRVCFGAAYAEVSRAMVEAPNSSIPPALSFMYTLNRLKRRTAMGQRHVDAGLLRIVGLADGGALQLTAEGEVRAKQMADDLIGRA